MRHAAGAVPAVTGWISGLDLDNAGFVIVGLFVPVRAVALAYWRPAKVEQRWAVRAAGNGSLLATAE